MDKIVGDLFMVDPWSAVYRKLVVYMRMNKTVSYSSPTI
jgi:hypothetical protein